MEADAQMLDDATLSVIYDLDIYGNLFRDLEGALLPIRNAFPCAAKNVSDLVCFIHLTCFANLGQSNPASVLFSVTPMNLTWVQNTQRWKSIFIWLQCRPALTTTYV